MILVTGTIDVDPTQRDAFIAAAKDLMTATRAEAGCELYVFSADVDEPGRFHLSERWEAQEQMDTHMTQPHMAAFFGAIGAIVKGSSITKWTGATGEKLM